MRALYTAASGMAANQVKIENIANNIANNGTTGFKKVRENFEDLVYQQLGSRSASGDAMQVGSGTRLAGLSRDFKAGDVLQSSSQTDMMLTGPGFFVVEAPSGETYYTRDGNFRTDLEGNLTTQLGYRVAPGVQVPAGGTLVVTADGLARRETILKDRGRVRDVRVGPDGLVYVALNDRRDEKAGRVVRLRPASAGGAKTGK